VQIEPFASNLLSKMNWAKCNKYILQYVFKVWARLIISLETFMISNLLQFLDIPNDLELMHCSKS